MSMTQCELDAFMLWWLHLKLLIWQHATLTLTHSKIAQTLQE